MKFFDPKKRETPAAPPQAVNPAPPPATPRPPAAAPIPPPVMTSPTPVAPPPVAVTPPVIETPVVKETAPPVTPKPAMVTQNMTPQLSCQTVIGSSLMIKGDVSSEEDILVHGFVEGTIETSSDVIIGPEGKVFANIRANNVTISGKVIGNVTAANKVNLAPAGLLQGNIRAPKLSIAESALFRGSIDMRPQESAVHLEKEKEERANKTASSTQLESVQK